MTDDPLLVDPGSGGDGFESLDGYRLLEKSPCIGAGKQIQNNGGRDFWGNELHHDVPNIGAFEGEPVTTIDCGQNNLTSPEEFTLFQNYPNPFNSCTTIGYILPNRSRVELVVYDLCGVKVKKVVDLVQDAGRHDSVIDISYLPSGTYWYTLSSGTKRQTQKMLLVK